MKSIIFMLWWSRFVFSLHYKICDSQWFNNVNSYVPIKHNFTASWNHILKVFSPIRMHTETQLFYTVIDTKLLIIACA